MRVLISGGGTAGHIYPALTVAERLVDGHDRVLFVGTPDGLESRLVKEAGIEFVGVPARGFDRSRPLTLVTGTARAVASLLRARRAIKRFNADVVVGFGGYVSIPVGLAAVLSRVPLVVHEQNSVAGLANRLLSRWAVRVAVTYEDSIASLAHPERVRLTGNPVRPDVLAADRARGRERFSVPEDATMLLVFGGSRGARHINSAMIALSRQLLEDPKLHVLHVAGRSEVEAVRKAFGDPEAPIAKRWRIVGYIDGMGEALAAADVVVSRAGATSIAELTALGKPAVLVPYPFATDDHQTRNARSMVEAGAALLVPDAELDGPALLEALRRLLFDADLRDTMTAASLSIGRPDAAFAVADLVREAAMQAAGSEGGV